MENSVRCSGRAGKHRRKGGVQQPVPGSFLSDTKHGGKWQGCKTHIAYPLVQLPLCGMLPARLCKGLLAAAHHKVLALLSCQIGDQVAHSGRVVVNVVVDGYDYRAGVLFSLQVPKQRRNTDTVPGRLAGQLGGGRCGIGGATAWVQCFNTYIRRRRQQASSTGIGASLALSVGSSFVEGP